MNFRETDLIWAPADPVRSATIVVRIEHPVGSFDTWKKAFDSDPVGRRKSGVRRYRILRPRDDSNYVMIDLEFDNAPQAETFRSAMRELWNSSDTRRVMQNPQLRIAEVVEEQRY